MQYFIYQFNAYLEYQVSVVLYQCYVSVICDIILYHYHIPSTWCLTLTMTWSNHHLLRVLLMLSLLLHLSTSSFKPEDFTLKSSILKSMNLLAEIKHSSLLIRLLKSYIMSWTEQGLKWCSFKLSMYTYSKKLTLLPLSDLALRLSKLWSTLTQRCLTVIVSSSC